MAPTNDLVEDNEGLPASPMPPGQAPARMASSHADEDENVAIDLLVQNGVTREYAEELVATHGTNWEALRAVAFAQDDPETSDGQQTESA